uniref:Uncharacterized protein n=1 Tax=Rhizophora mucronata TaxID=61149 RepID=A0A2P2IUP1_RHIMU
MSDKNMCNPPIKQSSLGNTPAFSFCWLWTPLPASV